MGFLDSSGLTRLWNKIKSKFVTGISYDSTTRKLKQTINGVTTDVATLNTMKIVTVTQDSYTLGYGTLSNAEYNSILEATPNVILHVVRYNDSPLYLTYNKNDTYGSSSDQYLHFTGMYASSNGCITVEGLVLKQETSTGEHNVFINNTEVYSTSNINTLLSQKQATLTFDSTPTANSNNPVKSSGIKTYVDRAKQTAIEIAEGKTKNIVIDDSITGTNNANTSFNSTNATITISFESNPSLSIEDVNNNPILLSSLKIGDIVSVIQTNVPDRWVGNITSSTITFYILETKLDITNTVTQNDARPVSSGAVYEYIKNYNIIDLSVTSDNVPTSGTASISDATYNSINESTILKCTLKNTQDNKVNTNYYTLFRKSDTEYIFVCLVKRTTSSSNGVSSYTLPTITIKHALSSGTHNVFYDYYDMQVLSQINGLTASKLSAAVQASLAKADGSVQSSDYITDSEIDAICI